MAEQYDIIFDAVGMRTFLRTKRCLTKEGRYVTTLPDKPADIAAFVLHPALSFFGYKKKVCFVNVRPAGEDLRKLSLLVKEKKLLPCIDRIYEMNDIADAHAYSETGRAKGKILIKIF